MYHFHRECCYNRSTPYSMDGDAFIFKGMTFGTTIESSLLLLRGMVFPVYVDVWLLVYI